MLDLDKPVRWKNDKNEAFITPARAPGYVHIEWQVGGRWTNAYRVRNALSLTDLENIPETVTVDVWCNVYPDGSVFVHKDKHGADYAASARNRIACIHIHREITVGEGL